MKRLAVWLLLGKNVYNDSSIFATYSITSVDKNIG